MLSSRTRLAVIVIALAVAFYHSLATLVDGFSYQSPLADLVLVPPIAVALMLLVAHRRRYVAAVRLTPLDLAVAAVLVALALLVLVVLPVTLSKEYWAMRLDLLMLPVFAAAAIVACFGLRGAVPFSFPLLFLTLAWPLPYTALLESTLNAFTHVTAQGARAVMALGLPFATAAGGDGLMYRIHGPSGDFVLAVGSACSGVNSLVGFFVVAFAMLALVRGPIIRRLAWLACGLVLVWLANILRIVAIFAAGHWAGQQFALGVLHPIGGLIALNIALVANLALLRLFGLRLSLNGTPYPLDSPLTREAPPEERATRRQLVPRFALIAAVAGVLAVANASLSGAAAGFDNRGVSTIGAFTAKPVTGPKWTATRLTSNAWSRAYFGSSSEWIRYRLRSKTAAVAADNRFTVWVDSIRAPKLGALRAHPVRGCYDFHGYDVTMDRTVALGSGVTGESIVYRNSDDAVWHVVTWEWPIRWRGHVQHERMVLLSSTVAAPSAPVPPRAGAPLARSVLAALNLSSPASDPNPALGAALRGIAGQLIHARLKAPVAS